MSNFLDILYLSVFFSKEKDRQARKWGGWPTASSHFVRFIPPIFLLVRARLKQTSENLRAFVRRCWFGYHVRSAKALRLGQPIVRAKL